MKIRILKVGNKFRPQLNYLGVFWLNYYTLSEEISEFDTIEECEREIERYIDRNSTNHSSNSNVVKVYKV